VFTANPDLADVFGLKSKKRVKLYNGPITCQLLSFNLSEQKEDENETGWRLALPSLREEAKDFSNRLRKNLKPFLKRAKKEGVSCFRIYDADMPKYNMAIDLYGYWVHVQEYAPPKTIEPEKAAKRLKDAVCVIQEVLDIKKNRIFVKVRQQQKGKNQYQKKANRGKRKPLPDNLPRIDVIHDLTEEEKQCACGNKKNLMGSEIRSGPLIQIDETGVQVLDEPGRKAAAKSYMWIYRGGEPDKPALVYQIHPTRSSEVPRTFLNNYAGYVQTDGYAGYEFADELSQVKHLGCWAHARRKFMETIKARNKIKKGKKKKGRADEALDYIGRLYRIEQSARDQQLSYDQVKQLRQKKAKPILDEFSKWLEKQVLKTPPSGLLGKAISYALGQWNRLTVYIEDGRLHLDNNLAENAIRPFVVGRKNWLFSATPAGAHASAMLYSRVETAKANGLEPYWYLRYLFERLPTAKTKKDQKALLPQYADRTKIGSPS